MTLETMLASRRLTIAQSCKFKFESCQIACISQWIICKGTASRDHVVELNVWQRLLVKLPDVRSHIDLA